MSRMKNSPVGGSVKVVLIGHSQMTNKAKAPQEQMYYGLGQTQIHRKRERMAKRDKASRRYYTTVAEWKELTAAYEARHGAIRKLKQTKMMAPMAPPAPTVLLAPVVSVAPVSIEIVCPEGPVADDGRVGPVEGLLASMGYTLKDNEEEKRAQLHFDKAKADAKAHALANTPALSPRYTARKADKSNWGVWDSLNSIFCPGAKVGNKSGCIKSAEKAQAIADKLNKEG